MTPNVNRLEATVDKDIQIVNSCSDQLNFSLVNKYKMEELDNVDTLKSMAAINNRMIARP